MLILTRKVGQQIQIGSNVTVTVKIIDRGRVSIGIQAPPEVKVLRGELKPHDQEATQ